jgi:O-glycosyl hydrolase
MKRKWMSIALVIVMVAMELALNPRPVQAATHVVDPSNIYVSNFEGWGSSLAWWGNILGGWSTTNRNAIADLIFGSSNLNLNILRYNIGGSPSPNTFGNLQLGKAVPSYLTAPGVYNWNLDANQRAMLSTAMSRGVNIVEAFSNSPPWFMTISGNPAGGTSCGDNLQSSQFDAFADYLTEVVEHFRDSWGVTFRTLAPLNEPNSTWWCATGPQEGAKFSQANQELILNKVGASLVAKGLTGTRISASDASSMDELPGNFNGYSTATKNYIAQLNTHSYGGSNRTGVYNLAVANNKRLWMSEYGVGNASALPLAAQITRDINLMKPKAWIYWQVVENTGCNCTWGLIKSDWASGSQTWTLQKQYYGMSNYSRFIKQGYNIIGSGVDGNTVAAFSPTANTLVLVTYNNTTSNVSHTYNLNAFATVGSSAARYRTSDSENLASLSTVSISNKSFTATANANSITTYVITGVTAGTSTSVNDNTTGTGNNQYQYTGTWSYGSQSGAFQNDNHWSSSTNANYQVRFNGTRIQLYGARANNHGIAAVSIDGGTEVNVDFYAATRADNVLLWTSPTLPAGNHTLRVRVTGTRNPSSSGNPITADRVVISP